MEADAGEDVGEKKLCNAGGVDILSARSVNYPLCKPMVNHDHDGVKRVGDRETGDEIDRDLFKWAGGGGGKRGKRRCGRVGGDFVRLARGTTCDKTPNET